MSPETMEAVSEHADWFASSNGTYLRVFNSHKSSHMLPRWVTNKLVMQEVAYHISIDLSGVLRRNKKAPWPTLLLQIGLYEIRNLKVVETKGKEIDKFSFGHMEYHPYDPRSVWKKHCEKIHFTWPSETYSRPEEEMIKNYYNAYKPHAPVKFSSTS